MADLRATPPMGDEHPESGSEIRPEDANDREEARDQPLTLGFSRSVLLAANTSNPAARGVLRDALNQALKGIDKGMEIKEKLDPYLTPLEQASRVPDAFDRLDGPVKSDSEITNNLRALARGWNREISPLASRTEQDWIVWSGLNVLDDNNAGAAVRKLEVMVEAMEHRRLIYQAGQSTVLALWSMDYLSSVKGLANGMVSTVLFDLAARREALETLARGEELATRGRNQAARALEAAQQSLPLSEAIRDATRPAALPESRYP
ncbi:hypothetical protein V5E97_17465 [Singulisphaera sp. Ch08]|uniref:Uncharacterized protein n=1 Tax=Singulisphaera sp. Ch08 TaxID=3120278 RepID=A0AAU7CRV7_9BACT